jgi:hypothetical protein
MKRLNLVKVILALASIAVTLGANWKGWPPPP